MSAEALDRLLSGEVDEEDSQSRVSTETTEGETVLDNLLGSEDDLTSNIKDVVREALPTHLTVFNPATLWDEDARDFETPIPLNENLAAALVGAGHMMRDTERGIRQMVAQGAGDEAQLAFMQTNEQIINNLYADPRFGGDATAGAVIGALAEPAGVVAGALMPSIKANSLRKAAAVGAITGGTFGGLGYVDEASSETRLKNTLLGMAAGGVLSTGIVAAVKGVDRVWAGHIGRVASNQIKGLEHEIAYNRHVLGMRKNKAVETAYKDLSLTDTDVADMVIKAKADDFSPMKATNKVQGKQILENWQQLSTRQQNKIMGTGRIISEDIEKVITPLTSLIERWSPKVANTVRKGMAEQSVLRGTWLSKTHDLRTAMRQLSSEDSFRLNKALITQEFGDAYKILDEVGISRKEFGKALRVMEEVADSLKESGYKIPVLKNYWHRAVTEEGVGILARAKDDALKAAIKAAKKDNGGRPLSPQQMNKVIERFVLKPEKARFKTGSGLKRRTRFDLDSITDEDLMKAYYRPEQALEYYLMQAADDISRAKVFKSLGDDAARALDGSDVEKTISRIADKHWIADEDSAYKLKEALKALYVDANKGTNKHIKTFKNLTYASLLGNPFSALTQAGDLIFTAHRFGIMRAAKSVARELSGNKITSRESLGIFGASTELEDIASKSKVIADWSMKMGLFDNFDKFGKEVFIDAAYRAGRKLATKNPDKFKAKWAKIFGEETDELVHDFATGKMSDNVKMVLFSELAEVQPVSLAEMPLKYLQHPNWRVLYMLRSFTMKQFDYMRRTIKGQESGFERGANLMKFAALFIMANGTIRGFKDYMRGDDPNPEEVVVDTALSMFGLSKWTLESAADKGLGRTAIEFVAPPVSRFDKIGTAVFDGDPEKALKETLFVLPVVGEIARTTEGQ